MSRAVNGVVNGDWWNRTHTKLAILITLIGLIAAVANFWSRFEHDEWQIQQVQADRVTLSNRVQSLELALQSEKETNAKSLLDISTTAARMESKLDLLTTKLR